MFYGIDINYWLKCVNKKDYFEKYVKRWCKIIEIHSWWWNNDAVNLYEGAHLKYATVSAIKQFPVFSAYCLQVIYFDTVYAECRQKKKTKQKKKKNFLPGFLRMVHNLLPFS